MIWSNLPLVCLGCCAVLAQPSPAPRVGIAPSKGRAAEDRILNPLSLQPHATLPKAAVAGRNKKEHDTPSGWETAAWTHSTLQVAGINQHSVAVATPSTVLVKASWSGKTPISVSVVQGSSVLGTADVKQTFEGNSNATLHVKVPVAATGTLT